MDSCTIILTTLCHMKNITKLRFFTCRYSFTLSLSFLLSLLIKYIATRGPTNIDLLIYQTLNIFFLTFLGIKAISFLSFLSNKKAHSLVYLTKNVILRNSIINQLQQNKCLFTSLID